MGEPRHGEETSDRPTAMPELAAHPIPPRDEQENYRFFPIALLYFPTRFRIYPIRQ